MIVVNCKKVFTGAATADEASATCRGRQFVIIVDRDPVGFSEVGVMLLIFLPSLTADVAAW